MYNQIAILGFQFYEIEYVTQSARDRVILYYYYIFISHITQRRQNKKNLRKILSIEGAVQ